MNKKRHIKSLKKLNKELKNKENLKKFCIKTLDIDFLYVILN